jgi:hypothetical protein
MGFIHGLSVHDLILEVFLPFEMRDIEGPDLLQCQIERLTCGALAVAQHVAADLTQRAQYAGAVETLSVTVIAVTHVNDSCEGSPDAVLFARYWLLKRASAAEGSVRSVWRLQYAAGGQAAPISNS